MISRTTLEAAWRTRYGPVWRSRAAAGAGAILIGIASTGFAWSANAVQARMSAFMHNEIWTSLVATPLMFAALAGLTRRFAPAAAGSGIPQVIAAARDLDALAARGLVSVRTAVAKFALTLGELMAGASVGREGPTVQIGAAVMVMTHRLFRVPLTSGVLIAGGAAGVAGAFNAPLAGVAFAIEELAAAYEQRLAVLVMGGVVAAGLVSQSIAGDYVYFGVVGVSLNALQAIAIAPLVGAVGGAAGGAFTRLFLDGTRWARSHGLFASRLLLFALACGVVLPCSASRAAGALGEPAMRPRAPSSKAASSRGGLHRPSW